MKENKQKHPTSTKLEYLIYGASPAGWKRPKATVRGIYKVTSVDGMLYNDEPKIELIKKINSYSEFLAYLEEHPNV